MTSSRFVKPLMLFFETLGGDVVEHIVRHLSSRPRSSIWNAFISAADVLTLYKIGGLMKTVCLNLFNGVNFVILPHRTESCPPFRTIDVKLEGARTLEELSQLAGFSYELISLAYVSTTVAIASDTRKLCQLFPNVQTIDTNMRSGYWVGKDTALFGAIPQLEGICRYKLVSPSCMKLRELSLRFLTIASTCNLSIWKSIGTALHKLNLYLISNDGNPRKQITDIQTHCRELRNISIIVSSSYSLEDAITDCYVSYGAQLRHAELHQLTASQCKAIRSACPNVRLSLTHSSNSYLAVLREVGPIIERLDINVSQLQGDDVPVLMSSCSRLRSLSVSAKYNGLAESACCMFAVELPSLTEVEIHVFTIVDDCDKLFRSIARSTSNLKRFVVKGLKHLPSSCGLLVTANPNLECVQLDFEYPDKKYMLGNNTDVKLAQIRQSAGVFSNVLKLRELCLRFPDSLGLRYNLPSLKEAFRSLRLSKVHVQVNKVTVF